MKKAIILVGPTATGKTNLAFYLSKKIPSVLISADSIQVYKGLNIISGKDHPKGTKIFLIDAISPFKNFSVGKYFRLAKPIISKALSHNKTPIIVGGTGFYVDALFVQVDTIGVPPNLKLRQKLASLSVEDLQEKLKSAEPLRFSRMNESDVKNKRRLIRAIEVATFRGSTPAGVEPLFSLFKKDEVLIIGLKTSAENLRRRITVRVEKRVEMGALDEARRLFRHYKNLCSQIKSAVGYKQLFEYLLGKVEFEEAKEKWLAAEVQVAKRQITYFRRNKNIMWFNIENPDFKNQVLRLVEQNFKI